MTDRIDAPDDAAQSVALWRAAIDLSGGAYTILRAVRDGNEIVDWEFVAASRVVEQRLSPHRPLRGQRWKVVNDRWDDAETLLSVIESVVRSGTPGESEVAITTRAGMRRWLLTVAAPMDADTVVVITRDVTGKRAAEHAVDDERARFRMLIDDSPGGLVVIDAIGTTKYLSPRAAQMFGAETRDDIDAKAMLEMVCDADRDRVREWFRGVVGAGPGATGAPISAQILLDDGSQWVCE